MASVRKMSLQGSISLLMQHRTVLVLSCFVFVVVVVAVVVGAVVDAVVLLLSALLSSLATHIMSPVVSLLVIFSLQLQC